MTKKTKKSDKLPKYGTQLRRQLVDHLTDLPGYQEALNKGLSFFTEKELREMKDAYEDGLTWDDIDRELCRKGIFLKKATFRKYIQDGNLSPAIDYRNTDKGRVAKFPPDTISHINFIQYFYKVDDGNIVDNVLELIKDTQITYLDAIESKLGQNLYAGILHYICFDDGVAYAAIEEALAFNDKDQKKILKELETIDDKFTRIIRKNIEKLILSLKEKHVSALEINCWNNKKDADK